MKKRLTAILVSLCLVLTYAIPLTPRVGSAGAIYFTGVNSTLLPLAEETMPVYAGVLLYVPYSVFSYAGIFGIPSFEKQTLRLYRGDARNLDFFLETGSAVSQDDHVYEDITARIIGGTFYVPLDFVCAYFGLRWDPVDCEPAPIIRIKSLDENSILNNPTFIGTYKERMYSEYNALTTPAATADPTDTTPPPSTFQPPSYEDITIYLSFFDLSAGSTPDVLDALTPGYRCSFFVTEEDILQNPALIRRIAGNGHSLGIRLIDGTYSEYLNVSALLFEAVKMRTVLIYSENAQDAADMANENGLIFWPASRVYDESSAIDTVSLRLPTVSGSRHNMLFSCAENILGLLPEMLDALRQGGYSIARITETVIPVR